MTNSRPIDHERAFTTFIGVDLGGGRGKNTAVARLQMREDEARVVYVNTKDPEGEPFFDEPLIRYLLKYSEKTLLAINAPLVPSVCFRCVTKSCPGILSCVDPVVQWFNNQGNRLLGEQSSNKRKPSISIYTQRACELIMQQRFGIQARETLGQGMGPLTARSYYLRRVLGNYFYLNKNLIEVYPKATVQSLYGPAIARQYKHDVNTWSTRAQILEDFSTNLRFEIWREGCLTNIHCFEAVIAAYTGYLWATQGWTLPDEDQAIFESDGWIWFPPLLITGNSTKI